MRIISSAVSLNVNDVAASSMFLITHFGFREEMAADGFASLTRDDAGMNVVFLRRGLESLPEDQRNTPAAGLILAFVVDDLECELARLQAEGVTITMPLTAEELRAGPAAGKQAGQLPGGRAVADPPGHR
jgi:catechol 2,3-dioxygenase-like lactoylglutathione lyase family enzyme